MLRVSLILAWCMSVPSAPAAPILEAAAVDSVANEALKAYKAPGLAIVVVRDGKVVYLKGHGLRELGKPDAVTPDTIFAIGSMTKAFTATAIGLLVDDGKMKWDDPVRKHLPWFRLADPLADRDVTLRDLLCHRTGLGPHNFLWYRAAWPVEESVRRLAFVDKAHSFRAKWDYNNICYLAAGLATAETAGVPWHEFVQKRLLDPLGMKTAVFTSAEAQKAADHATPHWRNSAGKLQPVTWYPDDKQIRASGSIKTGARDLARWIQFQLDDGAIDGKQLIAPATLQETHRPQMVERRAGREATQVSYGLGWRIMDFRRQPVLEHGGAVDGFRSHIVLLPKQRAGIAVLVNTEDTALVAETCYAVADLLLGVKDGKASRFPGSGKKRATRIAEAGLKGKPSREPAAYAGTYEDRAYGVVRVSHEDGKLMLNWSTFNAPLRHARFNTFVVPEDLPYGPHKLAGESVLFTLDADGTVGKLRFLHRTFGRKKQQE